MSKFFFEEISQKFFRGLGFFLRFLKDKLVEFVRNRHRKRFFRQEGFVRFLHKMFTETDIKQLV